MVQPTKEDTMRPLSRNGGIPSFSREYIHEKHPDWFHEKPFREHYNSDMFTGIEFDSTMLRYYAYEPAIARDRKPHSDRQRFLSESNDVRTVLTYTSKSSSLRQFRL
jgi:type I restriction enzyme M protein